MMTELQNLGVLRFLPYSCSKKKCWGQFVGYKWVGYGARNETKITYGRL